MVQRPWGRPNLAARGLKRVGTRVNYRGGRRQLRPADCLTRRPAAPWPRSATASSAASIRQERARRGRGRRGAGSGFCAVVTARVDAAASNSGPYRALLEVHPRWRGHAGSLAVATVAPLCPCAHLSRPARPWSARALPTQLRTLEAQAAEFLPPRGWEGPVCLGGRVGGRSSGRRLCTGVAGASQADWWPVPVGAGQ